MAETAADVAPAHLGAVFLINLELGHLTPSQRFEGS
jgi:TRAP-type C4-dicarboxylate transport system permease large subunit